jgi:hypothetical protein
MSKLLFEFAVEMDDGETFQVVADQRDVARFEVQPFGFPFGMEIEQNMGMNTFRYLAWSAAFRQQLTRLDWPAFSDRCVEVLPPDDEEASPVPADASHPGQPAPSATPSSRSRTRAGKH